MSERRLCGAIKNLANTCYLSCSLQIFLRYKPFIKKIRQLSHEFPDVEEFLTILKLADEMTDSRKVIDPKPIVDLLNLDPTKQQDICEFITLFLTVLADKLPKDRQSEIDDLFTCKIKSKNDHNSDSFFFYTIPVLSDIDIVTCMVMQISDREERFKKMPGMFFLQIHRMIYNDTTHEVIKNSDSVPIVDELDLRAYGGKFYKLFGTVQHIGSGIGGHYRMGIRDEDGWIMASDSHVVPSNLRDIMISSKSTSTPSYLLVFVEDMNDVITQREELIFDDEKENLIIDVDEEMQRSIFKSLEMRKVAEIISDKSSDSSRDISPLSTPKRTGISYIDSPKDVNRKIMCEYTPNYGLKKSPIPMRKINVIYQYFDQQTYSFETPEKYEFNNIREVENLVETYSSEMNLMFGFDKKELTKTIPEDLQYYDAPLYIMATKKNYRKLIRDPIGDGMIRVKFNVSKLSFRMFFHRNQPASDIEKYGTSFMKSVYNAVERYKAFIKIGYYLASIPSNKTISYLNKRKKNNLLTVELTTEDISDKRKKIPINLYSLDSFRSNKTRNIVVKASLNYKKLQKELSVNHLQLWILESRNSATIVSKVNFNDIFANNIEVRALSCKDEETVFVVVNEDEKFSFNFFTSFHDIHSFNEMHRHIGQVIKKNNFTLTLICYEKRIEKGDPSILISSFRETNTYFEVNVL